MKTYLNISVVEAWRGSNRRKSRNSGKLIAVGCGDGVKNVIKSLSVAGASVIPESSLIINNKFLPRCNYIPAFLNAMPSSSAST